MQPCVGGVAWPRLDMSPWITAISRVTSHVGFGLTYASTFMHPFYVARLLNSLDYITNGRIAFNVISSQRRSDYENYGYDELIDHGERYDGWRNSLRFAKRCGRASMNLAGFRSGSAVLRSDTASRDLESRPCRCRRY
jgi:alkanesulfonate monooxygenase SsuD/methylene tetrahydromethanopterin reductase-like flavin-dependent oxidoreductase (luciferase family)